MKQNSFKLLLGSKKFEIPTKFNQLNDISADIYDTLIFSSDHQYSVKSKVSEKVFESFVKYWISGETPDIRIDNFFEYSQLSDEFNLFKELIQQKKEEFGSLLNQFNNDEKTNISSSTQKDISFEDELNKLQDIINEQNTKMKNISNDLEAIKINDNAQFSTINNLLSNQSEKIQKLQKKQEEDISQFKNNQTNQLSTLKSTFQTQKKELVKLKYKHAQDTDQIKKQMKDQEGKLSKSNTNSIKFTKKDHIKLNPGKPFEILYDSTEKGQFKGIINYLTKECNGNVHKNGAVEITSSSVFREQLPLPLLLNDNNDYSPYNAADLDDKKSCFESDCIPNSWLCYDFIDAKVKPNAYSIRTYINGHSHMKSWSIEGSIDNVKWTQLDAQSNNYSLNDCGKSNTFFISNDKVNNYYRYLRIRQTDPNIQDSDILNISALEFFGSLLE